MASTPDQQPTGKSAGNQVRPYAKAAAKSILDNLNGKNFALSLDGVSEKVAREKAEKAIVAGLKQTLAHVIRESTQDVGKELEKKDAAVTRLERQIQPLQAAVEESNRILEQKDHDLSELRSQVKSLEEAEKWAADLKNENLSLRENIAEHEAKETTKQADHEDNEREYRRDRNRWESSERKLREDLRAAGLALEARAKEVDNLNNNLKGTKEDIKRLETLNKEYGKKLGENGELIPALENKVMALQAQCNDLTKEHQEQEGLSERKVIEGLERQFAAFRDHSEAEMKETREKYQKEVSDLQHEIACLKNSKGRVSPEGLLNPVASLADEMDEMDDLELAGPETALTSENTRLEDLECQLEQMEKERDEAVRISDEVKEAVRKDHGYKEEVRRLRHEKEELEQDMAKLQSLNDELEKKAHTGDSSEDNLQSQTERLEAKLREAENVKNHLEKQRDHANRLAKSIDVENQARIREEEKLLEKISRLQSELDDVTAQNETPPSLESSPSKFDSEKSSVTAASSVGNSLDEAAWRAEKEELCMQIIDLRSEVNTLEDSNNGLMESLRNSRQGPESHRVASNKSQEKQLGSLKQKYESLYRMYAVDLREQDDAMRSASKSVLAELATVPVTREQWDARYSHAGESLQNAKADLEMLETDSGCDAALEIAQRDVAQAEGAVRALQSIIHNIAGAAMLKRMLPNEYVPREGDQKPPVAFSRERPDTIQPPGLLNPPESAAGPPAHRPSPPAQLLNHPRPPPPPPSADTWSGLHMLYNYLPLYRYIIMFLNVLVFLALASSSIAEGRKYACWRAANSIARAVYISDRHYLYIPFPHMSFFWELLWRS